MSRLPPPATPRHTGRMETPTDDISPLVKRWMPDASEEEQRQATYNFREYLAVIYGIYLRLEAEKKAGNSGRRDKTS